LISGLRKDVEKLEIAVRECEALIRRGYRREIILKKIRKYGYDGKEIFEIARCRIKAREKFSIHNLYFDEYGLRYSTPELIGQYRAERIRGYTIADISCGVGMQAIFFSFTNPSVLGVDIDERRIQYARLNARAYNAKNIEFIVGDCFSPDIMEKAKKYDIIFSDPARKESEKERKLETLIPSPLKILEKYGEREYIFDLPPQISREKLPQDWEKEYISLNRRIKRLTAYTGNLRIWDRCAVSLPSKDRVCGYEDDDFTLENELSNYVYLVDESIYYASLLGVLERRTGIKYLQTGKRRTLATSSSLVESGFLKPYRVIYEDKNLDSIISCLRKHDVGKVTLVMAVEPGKYWKIRRAIEEKLKGKRKMVLFKINDIFVAGENVT